MHTLSAGRIQPLDDLLRSVEETLPKLPGFKTLSLFGSLAGGYADGYSDVDVIVTTDDLERARTHILGVLEQIGPVDFGWIINLRPDEWNLTVVFYDKGYYQKLDLGLVDSNIVSPSIPMEHTVLLCDRSLPPVYTTGNNKAYVPVYGSMGHFLLGQFIGCIRYVKAHKRSQIMTCYRFASAAVQWRLAMLYARLTENPNLRSKLSTEDYVKLDKIMADAQRDALVSSFDFSDMAAMDKIVYTCMVSMLEDGKILAAMKGESLPVDVFDRMTAFFVKSLF